MLNCWFPDSRNVSSNELQLVFTFYNETKYKTGIAVAPAFLSPSPLSEKSPDEYVSNARARKIN